MKGLAYPLDDDSDSAPVYWMGILFAAAALHILPLSLLTLPKYVPPPDDEVVSLTFDDAAFETPTIDASAAQLLPAPPSKEVAAAPKPQPQPTPPAAKVLAPPVQPVPAAETVEPPATVVDLTSAGVEVKKIEAPPAPPPVATKPLNEVRPSKPLNDIDLPPLSTPKTDTAFDENTKVAANAPKEGYLSDRNSTAADKGPKNLKRGDPYVDKGDTQILRYLGKRGEGDLPAFASDPASGSVKKEGAPVAGDGGGARAPDFSRSVKSIEAPKPIEPLVPLEPVAAPKKIEPKRSTVPEPSPAPITQPAPRRLEPAPPIPEIGKQLAVKEPAQVKPEPELVPLPTLPKEPEAAKIDAPEPARTLSDQEAFQTYGRPLSSPAAKKAAPQPNKANAQDELAGFMQELSGISNTNAAGDGRAGTGANLRRGEKGHEGDGTLRPGAANAVSDVTTVNLESSAAEFGDPRFEKKFDAKAAYIKAFIRRTDNKWKADIHANLRIRLVPGSVSIRIVLRKDGKLLEASEAHRDRGIPDEYVATAKRAVQEAADPSADPFPPALAGRDTIEYTFNFLYQ